MRNRMKSNDSPSQRRWSRIKTNGIVALTSYEKPVVTLIHDIAEGGLSFLHAAEIDVIDDDIRMDILIFHSILDFEYYISHVHGRVKMRQQVADPKDNVPVWRYHVEFIDLDRKNCQLLQIFCDPTDSTPTFVM